METDAPLKVLFTTYPHDLLPLIGDSGATVKSATTVELQTLERRVDCVLELQRGSQIYYRHLEFQAQPDSGMAMRCFRYNTQLVLHYAAPVVTTVVYLFPPRPKVEPVFHVRLGGREINRWTYEELFLWELDAADALASGAPGLMALTPLMHGGAERPIVLEAARRIEQAFPQERLPEAENVLLALLSWRYTESELIDMLGRDRMMQSSLYRAGHTEGRTEGRLEAEREVCLAFVRKHHPAVLDRALPLVETCQDPAKLREWALAAGEFADDAFLRLLGA